jgi:phage terminase large subunit-like protein
MDLSDLNIHSKEDIKNLDLSKMSREQKLELFETLEERKRKKSRMFIDSFFPETGPLRRELYIPHMEFFEAGAYFRERAFMAANRSGKTITGATELVYHLTGSYPDWWKGKRFKGRIDAWAAGKSNETTRDILQEKLLGPMNAIGTGLIPGDMIVGEPRRKPGVPDAIASVQIKNVQGGISTLVFKSYEQGRTSFEGVEKHVILLDEEPPLDIYGECLIRTMATGGFVGGIIILTFTPLQGMSEVVLAFMPGGKVPDRHDKTSNKFIVSATWDDAPHLSDAEKEELRKSIPPYQLDARSKGIPQLGSGAIFPIPESDIVVPDFPIPAYWPRSYGFDHGWNATAATWAAWNIEPEKPIFYLTDEYKRGMTEPEVHASNVKLRGEWIPGVSDPAAGTSSADGVQLVKTYMKLIPGLTVAPKGKAGNVESGLFNMLLAMSEGRFKVFESCQGWLGEFRLYRRDKNGKVVKENDHEMDSSRYVYEKGSGFASIMPVKLFAQRQGTDEKEYNPLTYELESDYDPLTDGF